MSTDESAPHAETGGLAEWMWAAQKSGADPETLTSVALSWLAQRLSDDDVVEAAAEAVATMHHAPGSVRLDRAAARAALAAAAARIGGGA